MEPKSSKGHAVRRAAPLSYRELSQGVDLGSVSAIVASWGNDTRVHVWWLPTRHLKGATVNMLSMGRHRVLCKCFIMARTTLLTQNPCPIARHIDRGSYRDASA